MPTILPPICSNRGLTRRCRSRRLRGAPGNGRLARGAGRAPALFFSIVIGLGALVPPPVGAQPAADVASAKPFALPKANQCESAVVVRCEPSPRASPSPLKERAQRTDERRRAPLEGVELDRIVIEGDAIRPTLADVLSRPFAVRPTSGTYTFDTGEGAQCTCMQRCPPVPFPCCDCSSPMNRYSAMPGASPLR